IYRLFHICKGDREPTVIIEAGIGGSLANWLPVQKALSPELRTCVYDRAGYGMSYEGSGARTAGQIAEELAALIRYADLPGPYILVGHSFGGYVVQIFARKKLADLAGVVLVDSSHPDQVQRLAGLDEIGDTYRHIINGPVSIRGGAFSDAKEFWNMLNGQRKSIFTQMYELKYFSESAEEVRNAGTFPDIPLAVITRDRELLPTTGEGHSYETEWQDMQRELVALSSHGWQTIARDSSHVIHIDDPDLLVREILKVRDSYRKLVNQAGE
ncbi:MAG: alpha/beta hydrolase, partial [Gammaproteobacteria bacterium]|nr:alpha/beta hydrolase [Gammaproteobacteria bacterium]